MLIFFVSVCVKVFAKHRSQVLDHHKIDLNFKKLAFAWALALASNILGLGLKGLGLGLEDVVLEHISVIDKICIFLTVDSTTWHPWKQCSQERLRLLTKIIPPPLHTGMKQCILATQAMILGFLLLGIVLGNTTQMSGIQQTTGYLISHQLIVKKLERLFSFLLSLLFYFHTCDKYCLFKFIFDSLTDHYY